MKIQNNKTITVVSLVIGLIFLSSTMVLHYASAITTQPAQNPKDQTAFNLIKQNMPKPLSESELAKAMQIAQSNSKVQSAITGKSVQLMSQGFYGNIYANPIVWYTTLNISLDNKNQLVVVVDLANGKVTDVSQGPDLNVTLSGGQRSWASDYYTGTSKPQGLQMASNAPTFTPNSQYTWTAFLDNGEMDGSNISDLCVKGATDAYFMQAGFFFDSASTPKTVWTDTNQGIGCTAMSTPVSYVAGHSYKFYIFADSLVHKWTAEVIDNTSGGTFIQTTSGQSRFLLTTNEFNNGVFFENTNTVQGSNTWNTQFSSSPFATALRESGGSWINWDLDNKQEGFGCKPNQVDTVISQNLRNGNLATWNLTTMAANYPAC